MARRSSSILNEIKKSFLRNRDGLSINLINYLLPGLDLDLNFDTSLPLFRHYESLNIILVPARSALGSSVSEILNEVTPEVRRSLEKYDTVFFVYDPNTEKYKYCGVFSGEEILNRSIDYRNPSDVQVIQSFISYYEHMIEGPSNKWDWNLSHAKLNYYFNGEPNNIELSDTYLREIFTEDSWYKNEELDVLFRKMLAPFSTDNLDEKTIYCHFYLHEEDDDDQVLFAEAANENTLAVDNALFHDFSDGSRDNPEVIPKLFHKNNALDYIYKPYLYHAFFDINSIPEDTRKEITDNLDETFVLKIRFVNALDLPVDSSNYLVFSASPSQSINIEVAWEKMVTANTVNIASSITVPIPHHSTITPNIRTDFDAVFSSEIKLKIYRVGQANFVYGYPEGKDKRFLFDCGVPTQTNISRAANRSGKYKDPINIRFISRIRPRIIIISHWDYDHFSGMFSFGRNVWDNKKLIVVAPYEGVNDFGDWGKRFLLYLESRNALCLIESPSGSNSPIYSCCGKGVLYQGKGKLHDKNNRSLLLKLSRTMLTGDCKDQYWPSGFDDPTLVENIILPHHGAKAVLQRSNTAISIMKNDKKYNIYICAGYRNQYGHPKPVGWFDPIFADSSKCYVECTNIVNPETSYMWRKPNPNKDPIEIDDA